VRHAPLCLALFAAAACAADLPPGVTVTRTAGQIVLANRAVELRFDAASGHLAGFGPVGGPPVITGGSTAVVLEGGKVADDAGDLQPVETDAAEAQGVLRLTSGAGDWRRTEEWRLAPDSAVALRQCRWRYLGTAAGEVAHTRLTLAGVSLPGAADAELVLPTAFPAQVVPFTALAPGHRRDVPDCWSTNGLVVVRSRASDRAVLLMTAGTLDGSWATVAEAAGSVGLELNFGAQLRLGHPAEFASRWQALALSGASRRAICETCWRAFDQAGLRAIANPAADAAVIYSAHPGGSIDTGFRDVGGFKAFNERLPYLKSLGFNTLWLLPFWHGWVYAPDDYSKLDAKLGSEADLKALVDRAHGLDLKVLGDLIPHGPREEGGLLKTHPDWVSAKHDGGVLYWWGCLGCDYACPGWQGFMADHAVDWMGRVGLDGYRVDCAGGGPANWRPFGDNWPSLSGIAGARGLLAAVRTKMQAKTPGSLLLTEGTAPVLAESGDLVYDFPWAYTVLPAALKMAPAQWVPAARDWLAWRRAMYPRGTRLMRYATSHDTVRGPWRYGPDLERAFLALNALADGVPMVYDGEDEGFADTLATVYRWRAALPALRNGEVDYDAVTSDDPRVMGFRRTAGGQTVVTAVNCGSTTVTATLAAGDPAGLRGAAAGPGSRVLAAAEGRLRTELAPGGAALWVVGGALPEAPPPAPPSFERPTTPADGQTLSAAWGQAVVQSEHGGRLARLTVGDQPAVWASHFAEGRRKLFLGVPPIDFDAPPAADGRYVLKAADGAPAVEVERRCELGAELSCQTKLTARQALERANAELVQSFDLGPAPEITVPTIEGELHFGPVYAPPRLPAAGDGGRYRHLFGQILWQSRQLPLAGPLQLRHPDLAIAASADQPGWLQNVRLRRDADTGGHVWLEVAWLDQAQPVSLAAGQSVTLAVRLAPGTAAAPVVRHEGPNQVFENAHYRLVLGRSGGGAIRELRRRTADGWGPNLVSDLNTYTDVGRPTSTPAAPRTWRPRSLSGATAGAPR